MTSMDMVIKGSFVIAAICRDGIIIASESRANIFDKTDKIQEPIAYYDTEQKVFPLENCAIAQTGQGLILNVFFPAVVKQISNSLVIPRVDYLLPTFLDYCQRNFPIEFVNEIRKQKLFAAGYITNHPTICYFNEAQVPPFGCVQDCGYIQSAPTIFQNHEPSNLSAGEAADLAEKAIEAYAEEGDRWKTIGGPVSVLLITQDGCQWIKNMPPEQKWTYIQDFVRDYRTGKIEINLIPPASKQQLDDLLSTVPGVTGENGLTVSIMKNSDKSSAPRKGKAGRAGKRPGRRPVEDEAELSPAQIKELKRRIRDSEDPIRYMLVSEFSRRFILYYNVSDNVFAMNNPSGGTLFKRREAAECVRKLLSSGVSIVKYTTKGGKLKRLSPYRSRWTRIRS